MRKLFCILTILICVAIPLLGWFLSGFDGNGPDFFVFIFGIALLGNIIFLGFFGLTSPELNTEIILQKYIKFLLGINIAIALIEFIVLKNANNLKLEPYIYFIAFQCITFLLALVSVRTKIKVVRRIQRTDDAKNIPHR